LTTGTEIPCKNNIVKDVGNDIVSKEMGLPGEHCFGDIAGSGQYEPGGHNVHSTEACLGV
jgi:hypothetical protein